MSKAKIFLSIGVWIAILSFLGFPKGLKDVLFVLTGFLIIYLSYTMYLADKKENKKEIKSPDNFSENHDFNNQKEEPNNA